MRVPKHVIFMMIMTLTIVGCSNTNEANEQSNGKDNPLDPTTNQTNDTELHDKLGYVKYSKKELDNSTAEDKELTVDSNEMADKISRIILHNKEFTQVATLVTDQEVLIAYAKRDEADEEKAEMIAKQSATAVIPSYFEVYASDNKALIQEIESLHNSSVSNNDYSNTLERIIDKMENPENDS